MSFGKFGVQREMQLAVNESRIYSRSWISLHLIYMQFPSLWVQIKVSSGAW